MRWKAVPALSPSATSNLWPRARRMHHSKLATMGSETRLPVRASAGIPSRSAISPKQTSKADNLATTANRATTSGDNRRQLLGFQIRHRGGVLQVSRLPALRDFQSEDRNIRRLMISTGQAVPGGTHAHTLIGSRGPGPKGSITTTKNDKMQNQQYHRNLAGDSNRVITFFKMRIGQLRLGVLAWPWPVCLRTSVPDDPSPRSLSPLSPG